jgi:hypothetical protein
VAEERILALELDRALAGEDAGDEARKLAALLVAAAEPARFSVSDDELERALRTVHPQLQPRARRPLFPALGLATVVAAAAVAAWIVHTPGSDVQAKAARALRATFFVVEEVRSAHFPATDISGYVDGRNGRAHVRVSRNGGGLAAETVLRPDGRVERWLAASNAITLAPSCAILPGGCAEALDPLDLYLQTVGRAHVRRLASAYELTIRAGRVEQVATIDAHTYLPRRIEWRQNGRRISVTTFPALERQRAPVGADVWTLSEHPGAHVVQLTSKGERVRVLSIRPSRLPSGARWLGPSYEGHRARVGTVELTGGTAVRIAYGPLVVWNYRTIVPPAVIEVPGAPAKIFEIPGGIVHASFAADGGVVADAAFSDGNTAVVSTQGDKIDTIRAVQHLVRAH